MEFLELLSRRESCRAYRPNPVGREEMARILEAGRLAPSGCNSQPWRFLVVDEPEALERMRDALVLENGKSSCPWRKQVPLFIALCEREARIIPMARDYYGTTQRFAPGDLAMAALNMCYAATELGLGSCVIGLCSQEKMRRYFGVPEDAEVRLILTIGHPAKETAPKPKVRKPLEEVCCFNHWSNAPARSPETGSPQD